MKTQTEIKHTPLIGTAINEIQAKKIVRAVNSHEALLEAAKEALCWLDPDCKLDGQRKTADTSDRENIIIDLYQAITQAEGK